MYFHNEAAAAAAAAAIETQWDFKKLRKAAAAALREKKGFLSGR